MGFTRFIRKCAVNYISSIYSVDWVQNVYLLVSIEQQMTLCSVEVGK